MTVTWSTPEVAGLAEVVEALASWQSGDHSLQLHPGDLGWFARNGAGTTAAALRVWRDGPDDGAIRAVGLLDGPDVLRLTVAPELRDDSGLAERLADDLTEPERGVLPAGTVAVEVPDGSRLQSVLDARGWSLGDGWTPLRRDLGPEVVAEEGPGLRIAPVDEVGAAGYVEVIRSAFGSTRFTLERWRDLAAGPPSTTADHLIGYDAAGTVIGAITAWSAGPGRTGLIEPLGVHADHRHHGYGRALCLAAAEALRRRGCTVAEVCTPSGLTGAVATYRSAGFVAQPERFDRVRGS